MRFPLALLAGTFLSALGSAHGGAHQPPAAPAAAPGPAGVRVLGGTASSGPTNGAPTLASTPTSPGATGPDLTLWTYWWQHNQAPFLNVKAHVRGLDSQTGSDGWFLGEGQRDQALSLRPTAVQVREEMTGPGTRRSRSG